MKVTETLSVVRVITEKQIIMLRRYWINTASGLATNYILFLVVFFGGQQVAPAALNESLEGIIVGFFLWSLSWTAFQLPASSMMREAQWGTLEQLYMTPVGFFKVLSVNSLANITIGTITRGVYLLLLMITTGRFLSLDLLTIAPLLLLTLASAIGLGFVFSGLALIYKRISRTFMIGQYILAAAIAAPSSPYIFNLLPMALGYDLLVSSMSGGVSLWNLPEAQLMVLVIKAVAYTVGGGFVFAYCVRVAKRRGVMGHY